MVRKYIIFYGRVQGVGFRFYAVNMASHLGLTGWVCNLYDGTVEMEVQGREEQIDQLIQYLKERRFINITDMRIKKIPVTHERDFRERGY